MKKQKTIKGEVTTTCPRCKRVYLEFPALSRRDNKTNICSQCGQDEAMFDFKIASIKADESKWLKKKVIL